MSPSRRLSRSARNPSQVTSDHDHPSEENKEKETLSQATEAQKRLGEPSQDKRGDHTGGERQRDQRHSSPMVIASEVQRKQQRCNGHGGKREYRTDAVELA